MCATTDKNTHFNISKIFCVKSGFQILYAVEQFSSLLLKDKLKARGTYTPTPRKSWENCRVVPNQQLPYGLFGAGALSCALHLPQR